VDVPITELEKIDADRVDGVGMPANGIPILMMKQVAEPAAPEPAEPDEPVAAEPDEPAAGAEFDREAALELVKAIVGRKVDETPDIAGGTAVLAQIADLIIAEAQELKSGQAGEIADIQQLACAAEMIWCWRTGEESVASGSVMPATALMQSAREWTEEEVEDFKVRFAEAAALGFAKDSREFSADERKKHAAEGNALPDGSYPIPDKDALRRAAVLARSGHGDVAAAKRLIARRAKALGVANPLDTDDDTSKEIAKDGADVDTETQTGDLNEVVKAAEAKAAALEKRVTDQDSVIKALEGRLAKVEQAPVLGGPVMSAVRPGIAADDDHARKARYYDEWAERVSDPSQADSYRQLAAQERAKITS
jgi:hypothetical protein